MVAIVGEGGLAPGERRALAFADEFERDFVGQGAARRTIAETIEAGWRLLDRLPADDLLKLNAELLAGRESQRRLVAAS
jgi:V/A-type H+-transporting ATPase subunit B